TTTDLASGLVTINLAAGAAVTCTYTNAKQGSITINKTAVNGDGTFNFTDTGSGVPASFQITTSGGTGSQSFTGLGAGTYTITEGATADFNLTNLSCTGGSTSINATTVTITLAAGDAVSCTYTNTTPLPVPPPPPVLFGKPIPTLSTWALGV